ncbi:DUF885 family protein [Sphingomonas baiyangensis]|uniref:DUF885 domain-containing protein n=1 Tax=Sphingomonas baiyangensis TaxID=2572576 RepID=A0A4U1KZV4_9SPHN|nr:DUF885 family protein [Sphingomonas baiyangensis]TKD49971.1 DUF885 domain-containing protein [Sphingomonas baiyangensis]
MNHRPVRPRRLALALALVASTAPLPALAQNAPAAAHAQRSNAMLDRLFTEWRAFEASGKVGAVHDYREPAMVRKAAELKRFQARLDAIDRTGWSVPDKVDWNMLRAEMNGLDFDLRVLRPWQRDPAYYATLWAAQSDTPEHEGPVAHGAIELWQFRFPLDAAAEAKLTRELATIAPFLAQGRENLTGNARDLWAAGIVTMEGQAATLADLAPRVAGNGAALRRAVADAQKATGDFIGWLKAELPKKDGPSGVGRENYDWYLRNVQLSPLDWAGEVAIMERELGRSHAALRLEENRNRALPLLPGADSPAAYDAQAKAAVRKYLAFLGDREILTVRDYMEPALMERIGSFVPPDRQNFFHIAMHRAPMTLWTHFYHWFDLANMKADPHPRPIRRGPLLYNVWVSRSEGQATAMEEAMLHAGLFDDQPRAREIVWIMQAQRAARGLASLYAHANIFTMKEAQDFQVARTPNGWMSPTLELLAFEQQLYLRQPGYGTSYITGKHQVDKLMGELAERDPKAFSVKRFYDGLNTHGMIPMSMVRWEMLGDDSEAKAIGAE